MFAFLRSLFSSRGIPSTADYEKQLFEQEARYARFLETQESPSFKRYSELKEYVTSPHFASELNRIKALSFVNSHEALVTRRFNELKKHKDVKRHLATGEGMDSKHVQEYLQLQREMDEPAFVKQVEYLKNKKRHKQSDAYLCYLEFKELDKSESIRQFLKLRKKYSALFAEQERWVSKLYDDFSKEGVDQNRWMLKPFWGEQLLKGNPYSLDGDLQLPLEQNVQQHAGALRLVTKAERATGLQWSAKLGMVPRAFDYTSGMVSTALSFRQLYGKFEAKVRVSRVKGVYHSFWLGTDTSLPHVNVFKFDGSQMLMSVHYQEGGQVRTIEQRLNHTLHDDYYIYTLLWNEKSIVWQINGFKVFECPNVINVPMYLAFSSGVRETLGLHNEPLTMELGWVRCFRENV